MNGGSTTKTAGTVEVVIGRQERREPSSELTMVELSSESRDDNQNSGSCLMSRDRTKTAGTVTENEQVATLYKCISERQTKANWRKLQDVS